MTKVTMKLEGLETLQRALTAAPHALRRHTSDVIRETTWQVADRMRQRVPVRTGTLLSEIEAHVPVTRGVVGRITIGPEAWYWRFVEYGTVRVPARPFIRPATDEESGPFLARINAMVPSLERDMITGTK